MTRPFEGIRVIDVTHVLAGPFAAYQLAVLGADVIKVEHPDDPDQSRGSGTDKALNRRNMGTAFLTQASNKRSIALDLKQAGDREVLKKLVATADVFVENYRPGAFEALGLGYEALAAINPRLIYASFSAFGQNGPRGGQTAYDHVIQATSGIMAMTGTKDVHPVKIGAPAIDYATGMTGAFALSAALFQRERTGRGQRIDMAMLDVAMILMSSHLTGYLRNGVHPKPHGNRHPARHQRGVRDQGGAGDAGRQQSAPAAPPVDAARAPRHDQAHQRRARRRSRARDRRAVGDHALAHRRRMGGVPAGPPRPGGARAHHGGGAGRPAARKPAASSIAMPPPTASRAPSPCRWPPSPSPMAAPASTPRRPRSASTTRTSCASSACSRPRSHRRADWA